MGLRDKLVAAKRYVWSPMTLTMLEQGSDTVVKAGHPARVFVDVEGEPDDTAERIELRLKLGEHMTWPVAEVPMTAGRHELDVLVPADAPPTSRYSTYYWMGTLHRSKGVAPEALCPIRVIGHPDHVYWPDGPQSGVDGSGVSVALDETTVNTGGAITGRTTGAETVEVGPVLDTWVEDETSPQGEQRKQFTKLAEVQPGPDGAFRVDIPTGAPPTLYNGDRTWITWEVRATAGGAAAWQRFAVLDPDGTSEATELTRSSLLDLIG